MEAIKEPGRNLFSKYSNEIILISGIIVGSTIGIIYNILLSQLIGPSGYGNFKVAETFYYLCASIAVLGGPLVAPIFLHSQISDATQNSCWHYVKFFSLLSIVITVIIAAFVFVGHKIHVSVFDGEGFHVIYTSLFIIPLFSVFLLLSGVLHSANRIFSAFFPWMIGYSILGLAFCYFYSFQTDLFSEMHAMMCVGLAFVIMIAFSLFYIKKHKLMPIKTPVRTYAPLKWLSISIPVMITVTMQFLLQKIDIFMVEILAGEIAVGHLAAAQSINWIFFDIDFGLGALFAIQTVKIATDDRLINQRFIIKGTLLSLSVITPIAIGIFIFGHDLLSLYEHNTEDAYWTLIFIAIGYIGMATCTCAVTWLQYTNRQNMILILFIIGVVMNTVLNWVLIPIFDIEGAGFATMISMLFICFSVLWMMLHHFYFSHKKTDYNVKEPLLS